MRKMSAIDALFPGTRKEILATLLLTPNRWWFLSDLARHLKLSPSTLQRELPRLTKAGVLQERQEGKHIYYKANEECPFFSELQGLFIKTAGIVDVLRDVFKPHRKKVEIAFIYGSIAQGEEVSSSDVDLMVVGNVGLSTLAVPLQKAQERIQRPVNATVYSPSEFSKKVKSKNHFLRNVFSKKMIFIIGDETDLEKITG